MRPQCGRQSRSHSCSTFSSLDQVVDMPVVSTTDAGCRSAENCEGPAVAAHSTRWSMSLLAQFIDKIWTSCDHAATVVQWKCLRFRSSPESWTVQFCNREWYSTFYSGDMAAVKGLFDAFCVIFRAPPGCPGVEGQFLEPSMVKSSSPSRAPLANWIVVTWTYTHS